MDVGMLSGDETRLDAEDVTDAIEREHFTRSSVRDHSTMVQQHDLIGKARGEIEIMNHADNKKVGRIGKRAHFLHEIDLNISQSERTKGRGRSIRKVNVPSVARPGSFPEPPDRWCMTLPPIRR